MPMRERPVCGNEGFSILEVLIAFSLLGVFIYISFSYSLLMNTNSRISRTLSARDRVTSAVRALAGMPAALRNSMTAASTSGIPVNAAFAACTQGSPSTSCTHGSNNPLTLFSPLMSTNSSGQPYLTPVTAPSGVSSASPARFDIFGSSCSEAGPNCPLEVYTSFSPQCGPRPLPVPPPAVITPEDLAPQPQCTVADVILVNFWIRLDPTLAASNPGLGAFVQPVTGSVSTPAQAISGNMPQ